jgi:AbiTii
MMLDEIITILSSTESSLTDALLKVKVLLYRIGQKDLATWVTCELKGYPGEEVPEYRTISMLPHAHITSMTMQHADYQLPITHLKPETQKNLTIFHVRDSIHVIEEAIKKYHAKGGSMRRPLPPETASFFGKALHSDVNIISAWCEVNMGQMENILIEVRSRLLDFVLELQDVVGKDADEAQLEKKAASMDTGKLFNTAIYGSGNTVILGISSIQSVTATNTKGDIEELIAALAKAGIPTQELIKLRAAISQDKAAGKVPDIGEGKTGHWFTKLLSRAASKTVDVSVDLISSVVAKTLAAYNGHGVN